MKCEQCKKEIDGSYGSGRFCNRSCATTFISLYNRRERNEKIRITLTGPDKVKSCKECNEDFIVGKSGTGLYCNKHRQYRKGESFDLIRSDSCRRECLKRERGHQCEVCDGTLWMEKPIPIELDHIDGVCTNNDKSNLRLICPNCHAQTDTYKGKNIGRVKDSARQKVLKKHPISKYRKKRK